MSQNMDIKQLWDENIADILSKQPKERRDLDEVRIKEIHGLVALSKLGKQLLDWADKNDIKILMDNQTNAGGYYCAGFKTIGLNAKSPNMELAETLAHELRHAWQDKEGLIPVLDSINPTSTVQEYIAQVRFVEADAFAFGTVVEFEMKKKFAESEGILVRSKWPLFNRAIVKACKADDNALENGLALALSFHTFFQSDSLMSVYEERSLKIYAKNLGLEGIKIPISKFEYITDKKIKTDYNKGLNTLDMGDVSKLGDIFSQYSYMKHMPKDFNKQAYYRGRLITSKLREKDFCTTMGKRYKKSDRLLMRYVKHLQKQRGINK